MENGLLFAEDRFTISFSPRQSCPFRVGSPDLQIDEQVEPGQAGKGQDVHDHQVEPRDVETDVELVVTQRSRDHLGDRRVHQRVERRRPSDLPKSAGDRNYEIYYSLTKQNFAFLRSNLWW